VTRVVSIRAPEILTRAVRLNATRSQVPISQLVSWLLGHVLEDGCDLSRLEDTEKPADAKLDIRLTHEMVSRIRAVCDPHRVRVSVCIRAILYAYYTRRLVFVQAGDRYKLVANYDQT
jgi:hypothetical protein